MTTVDLKQARMQAEDARDDERLLQQLTVQDRADIVETLQLCDQLRYDDDAEEVQILMRHAGHGADCTTTTCYCYDQDQGDPMCACGQAACFCRCPERANDLDPYDEDLEVAGFAHPWDGEAPSKGR